MADVAASRTTLCVNRGMVHAGGDAARGEPRNPRPPSKVTAHRDFRQRHTIVQRRAAFPTRGKSTIAAQFRIFFAGQGLSTYIHVTDQRATDDAKIIITTPRGALCAGRDPGNAKDLPISEHATNTRGRPGQLRVVRPARHAALAPHQGTGKITLYQPRSQSEIGSCFPCVGPAERPRGGVEGVGTPSPYARSRTSSQG